MLNIKDVVVWMKQDEAPFGFKSNNNGMKIILFIKANNSKSGTKNDIIWCQSSYCLLHSRTQNAHVQYIKSVGKFEMNDFNPFFIISVVLYMPECTLEKTINDNNLSEWGVGMCQFVSFKHMIS